MPIMPCIFHQLCLPGSLCCGLYYYGSKRRTKLEQILKDFNSFGKAPFLRLGQPLKHDACSASPMGIQARLNKDFEAFLYRMQGFKVEGGYLAPQLELFMIVPQRQKYCADHGISFDGHSLTTSQPTSQFSTLRL